MTSLIDVIFLLLLFFMLSSTFSRFAEVEIVAGQTGGTSAPQPGQMLFLRLTGTGISLNGQTTDPETLEQTLTARPDTGTLLVSVTDSATAQALTDLLVILRAVPGLNVSVLEAS